MKFSLIFLFLASFSTIVFAQNKATVKISGFAPAYIGKTIEFMEIVDYFSMNESRLGSATVQEDSTFSVQFYIEETQKIRVRSNNNQSFMYIEPNATYSIYIPEMDRFTAYRPAGNEVEITFFDIDSTDINYKILQFNRWVDDFVANNFNYRRPQPVEFAKILDTFKVGVHNYYVADTGKYIYDYVRYTMSSLDNIQHAAERNRYEKHDFYLKYSPVLYRNDAYMDYFINFYRGMMPKLAMETNNRVYTAVLKSSPTEVMRALGKEYTLINMRIRELVMIQSLSEVYFQNDFPQTNIITILDSVANHALFQSNKIIAKNMIMRLTEVVPGGRAPEFVITSTDGTIKTMADFKKKHLYIHFFDPSSDKNKIEIPLLIDLYAKYLNDVTFITICKKSDSFEASKEVLDQLPWESFVLDESNPIFKNYRIASFPSYVFLDGYGYVIGAPALGPQPNGAYETIDKTFFQLQKVNKEMRGEH